MSKQETLIKLGHACREQISGYQRGSGIGEGKMGKRGSSAW